jgi:hypothetical protein
MKPAQIQLLKVYVYSFLSSGFGKFGLFLLFLFLLNLGLLFGLVFIGLSSKGLFSLAFAFACGGL